MLGKKKEKQEERKERRTEGEYDKKGKMQKG